MEWRYTAEQNYCVKCATVLTLGLMPDAGMCTMAENAFSQPFKTIILPMRVQQLPFLSIARN